MDEASDTYILPCLGELHGESFAGEVLGTVVVLEATERETFGKKSWVRSSKVWILIVLTRCQASQAPRWEFGEKSKDTFTESVPAIRSKRSYNRSIGRRFPRLKLCCTSVRVGHHSTWLSNDRLNSDVSARISYPLLHEPGAGKRRNEAARSHGAIINDAVAVLTILRVEREQRLCD